MKQISHRKLLQLPRVTLSSFHRSFHFHTKPTSSPTVRNPNILSDNETNKLCRLLDACIRSKSLEQGVKIHHQINKNIELITNYALAEKIVLLYIACNEVSIARKVFDKIPSRSIFLWNSMIRAYSWKGPFEMAIKLYHNMVNSRIKPNKFTFPFVLRACSSLCDLEVGTNIHNDAKRFGFDQDLYVSTALIDMYLKCGSLEDAQQLFDIMPKRDIVSWNAMVSGYALHNIYNKTISLILQMQKEGSELNSSTIVSILPLIGQEKSLKQGKTIHGFCIRNFLDNKDVMVQTALLDMYAKCEYFNYARKVFDKMAVKNEVTWSAMIGGYVLSDRISEALNLFNRVFLEGSRNLAHPTLASVLCSCAKLGDLKLGKQIHSIMVKLGFISDLTSANSLLSMYAKTGQIGHAFNLFDEMPRRDTVSHSALISGCVQNGHAEKAFDVFRKMRNNKIKPDAMTLLGIIPACAHVAALRNGNCAHAHVIISGSASETVLCNSLIDMYAKCGRIDLARKMFDKMPERDVVSWNSMIAGYGMHGLGKEAISFFYEMKNEGFKCDDITFICLISACSHSGLVNEGKHLFNLLTQNYKITPRMEHYICMVDLLGRGGFLNEAFEFITKMPLKPDVHTWGALLGACRIHKNIELGKEVSRRIRLLGHETTGNFVLLSNMLSVAGRFEEAARVRIMQRDKGFKKSPGCSWIEIEGVLHAFSRGDTSHRNTFDIYKKLNDLMVEIRKLGYRADTSFALHDLEEEEKEEMVLYHSEKLAIAFGILSLRKDESIFVTKNLRVCGDCHSAIKYISLAAKRDIVVRDVNRFHHFRNGICSCGDFW